MPGLSIITNSSGLLNQSSKISETLNSLNYLDNYSSNVFLLEDKFFIGWNKYNEYPIKVLETNNYRIIIEGRIYNKSESLIGTEITQIFDNFSVKNLSDWLQNSDGDFIIYLYNKKTRTFHVFNDLLGRMPLYYKITNDGVLISRYIRFITTISGNFTFDKIAIGEFLLFGYLLRDRTLIQDIKQLRPATLITIDEADVSIKEIYNFNFENRKHKDKKLTEIIDDVSELFSQACNNRLNNGNTNLVALSSGLDSRTVAACMHKNKIPFKTVTMVYKNGHGSEEVSVAKQIAELFNVEWNSIEIYPPTGEDVYTLLKLKEGIVHLATAPLIPFYKSLIKEYGNTINYISGDKGDKITLSFDNPIKKFNTSQELIDYILDEHSFIKIDDVCSLFSVKKDDLLEDIDQLLESYPENDLSQKYIHFRAIEKSHKLAFQGDDRHKRYFWNYCPLTSVPFVNYLFNCSDESKKMHKVFIGLLKSFSPDAANILYTNFKAPITSLKAKFFMSAVYYIYPRVPTWVSAYIKTVFFGGNPYVRHDSIFYKFLEDQMNNTKEIQNYFNFQNVSQLKKHRMYVILSIFTITSLIEDFYKNGSTLLMYRDKNFDYKS